MLRLTLLIFGLTLIVATASISWARHTPARGHYEVTVTADREGKYLYLKRLHDGKLHLIMPLSGDYVSPLLSPDGQWIAFVDYSLYRVRVNGTDLQQLTTTFDGSPSWSPDGEWITYQSYQSDNWDIYRINIKDGRQEQLTDDPADDAAPRWSPDGEWIAFQSYRGNHWNIFRMNVDGGDELNLTNLTDHSVFAPEWSPDGAWIGFYYNFRSIMHLTHIIRPDGSYWELLRTDPSEEWALERLPPIQVAWRGEWLLLAGLGMMGVGGLYYNYRGKRMKAWRNSI